MTKVHGTTHVTQKAAAATIHHHAKKHHHHHHHAAPRPAVQPTAPAPVPAAAAPATSGWTNCNPGTAFYVMANGNTSCPFANNVASSYNAIGNGTNYVTSPTTGQTYAMDCEPDGTGAITCTGGNNAAVRMYVTEVGGVIAPPFSS
jgi:hypothetical protein